MNSLLVWERLLPLLNAPKVKREERKKPRASEVTEVTEASGKHAGSQRCYHDATLRRLSRTPTLGVLTGLQKLLPLLVFGRIRDVKVFVQQVLTRWSQVCCLQPRCLYSVVVVVVLNKWPGVLQL